mmetsp:Transcript_31618/g.94159  ORF Transcript_31618/g.94159 Transcript_31618/m.94159 type:complete len:391 (+) Transcript_31618:16-1188(+)
MGILWEVVGGTETGGILIREGQDTKSTQLPERLATGALVEELALVGGRLQYRLVPGTGTGPEYGWASVKVSGKDLVVPREDRDSGDNCGPGASSSPVEADEGLRAYMEGEAKARAEDFPRFVPKYKVFKFPLAAPKFRVFCFHNAGSAESNYSAKGTPFTDWVVGMGDVEFLSLQYPGRENMLKERRHTNFDTLCPLLLSIIYDKVADGVPYVIWGHSVGTWVSFELLMLIRQVGLPAPKAALLNGFPAPHFPVDQWPWHQNRKLDDAQMREETLLWDKEHFTGLGAMVFREEQWDMYEPIMRADFRLFDEYRFKHGGAPKFDFPLHCWHMEGEHYNKPEMIQLWGDWTTAPFDFQTLPMGHLTCFYKPEHKKEFFTKITDVIKGYYTAL